MRASSPPIAIYKAPLKGMDAREVKPEDAPNLLFNVDLSNRGYWKERPSVEAFKEFGDNDIKIMGLYSFRVDEKFYLVYVYAVTDTRVMMYGILDGLGNDIVSARSLSDTSSWRPEVPDEPYNEKNIYCFINAGRFVYFCNGYGNYYELEVIGNGDSFSLNSVSLEEGKFPNARSYALGNIRPSSLTYFSDQIVASGFTSRADIPLSAIVPEGSFDIKPPPTILGSQRLTMTIDPSSVCVAEYGLWRSFALSGDPSGFHWIYTDQIMATAGIGTELLLFGKDNLYKIIGMTSNKPMTVKLSALSSVGPKAHCYFDRYVLFVCLDGIYITDGSSLRKVSYSMDPLWFGTRAPQTTRHVQQKISSTPFPFHVNRRALRNVCCVDDKERRQVMISLPANDSQDNNMIWVYNYADMLEGVGEGKWSIWGTANQPEFNVTPLDNSPFAGNIGFGPTRNNPATNPTQSNPTTAFNLMHWTCVTDDVFEGKQRIFAGTNRGRIVELTSSPLDIKRKAVYNVNGERTTPETFAGYPVVLSMGRIGRVDSDGRIICTDVAVRRKQLSKNPEDSYIQGPLQDFLPRLACVVRSEGEGLKHFDVSEADVEFQDSILASQQGVSENTKSTLSALTLGASPAGSNAPLMSSEYFESYARVNTPDEEGRAAYVDLFSIQDFLIPFEPHRLEISEVRVYANVKGGSQREQS